MAVEDQVSSENKDTDCKNGNDFEGLKAENSVPEKENLVNFEEADETLDNPWEGCLEWGNAELLEMVTNLRLIHLKQIFEELAKTDNALWMARYRVEIAEIFAVKRSENEVAVLLAVRDKA